MAKLYVVATPIGNLNDLTPRMREALENCDLVCAEDTRVTMKLLQVLDIHKPLISCHRHNEDGKKDAIIEKMLAEDLTVSLTCDAGTPGISDPGEALVAAAWEAGVPVIPVSGPSAAITALSASGFDTREFAFFGFLPRENKELKEKLLAIHASGVRTCVLHESPHRVVDLIEKIAETLPGTRVCVCCDLTKKFERIDRGDAQTVLETLKSNPSVEKGEYCIVCELTPYEKPEASHELSPEQTVFQALLNGKTLFEACAEAKDRGLKRNDIYRAKLAITELAQRILDE